MFIPSVFPTSTEKTSVVQASTLRLGGAGPCGAGAIRSTQELLKREKMAGELKTSSVAEVDLRMVFDPTRVCVDDEIFSLEVEDWLGNDSHRNSFLFVFQRYPAMISSKALFGVLLGL